MSAALPSHIGFLIDQTDVRFVDQGRGRERVPRFFLRDPGGGQASQFLVNQRQKLVGGLRVALLDRRQDLGHGAHGLQHTVAAVCRQKLP
jgi:hypothetical protein